MKKLCKFTDSPFSLWKEKEKKRIEWKKSFGEWGVHLGGVSEHNLYTKMPQTWTTFQ